MAIQLDKLSDRLWVLRDGSTALMEINGVTGQVNFPGAGVLNVSGKAPVLGVDNSIKIARSAAPVALDGSNPTSVAHGLTSCLAAFAQLVGSAAPGDSTMLLTAVINGANIDVYAWKHTDGTDPTLVASTGTETFNWFAIGT